MAASGSLKDWQLSKGWANYDVYVLFLVFLSSVAFSWRRSQHNTSHILKNMFSSCCLRRNKPNFHFNKQKWCWACKNQTFLSFQLITGVRSNLSFPLSFRNSPSPRTWTTCSTSEITTRTRYLKYRVINFQWLKIALDFMAKVKRSGF